jgi:WD40 repeat protein
MVHRKIVVAFAIAVGVLAQQFLFSADARPVAGSQQSLALSEPAAAENDIADPLPKGAIARLGTMRFRHPAQVAAAALAADGKTMASAGHDSCVRLWDAAGGKELRALETPGRIPAALAFSPDGKIVAAGSFQMLRLWDVTTGKELAAFRDNETSAYGLAFSSDGKLLASAGGDDLVVRIWEIRNGKELHRLAGQRGWAGSVAFAPDSRLLATAGGDLRDKDGGIRLWDPMTGKLVRTLDGHTAEVTSLAFSSDGKLLASSSRDDTLRFWDPATGKELRQAKGLGSGARSLAFSADRAALVSGEENALRVWDVAAARELRRFRWQAHDGTDGVVAAAFFPDGQCLATAHTSGLLRIWDPATGAERFSHGHYGAVRTLAVSPDGKWLVSAEDNPVIHLWDLAAHKEVRQHVLPDGHALCVAFSGDSRLVAAGSSAGQAVCWDVLTGKEMRYYSSNDRSIVALAFAPDGKGLVASLADGTLLQWPVKNPLPRQTGRRAGLSEERCALAFASDGKTIALGAPADRVHLFHRAAVTDVPLERERDYEIWEGTMLLREDGPRLMNPGSRTFGAPGLIAFAPDGRTLAARAGGKLTLWEVIPLPPPREDQVRNQQFWEQRAAVIKRMVRADLPGGAQSLAYAPDGRLLALGRTDGTIVLWDTWTATELHRFQAHEKRVHALAFVPRSTSLASAGDDNAVLVWDVGAMVKDKMPAPAEIPARDLPALWTDLTDSESARAFKAQGRLILSPRQAVPLLDEKLCSPPPVEAAKIKQLVEDLDSQNFDVRQKATAALEQLGEPAETALQHALAVRPSLEMTRRLEELLRKRAAARTGELLRVLRALEVLERIGTPEASRLVKALAQGAPEFPRVDAAQGVLRRMTDK